MTEWLREWQIYFAERMSYWPLRTIHCRCMIDLAEFEDEEDEEITDKEKEEMVEK